MFFFSTEARDFSYNAAKQASKQNWNYQKSESKKGR